MPAPGALDTRAKWLLAGGLLLLLGVTAHRLWLAPPPAGPYVTLAGATMGTTWSVKVASHGLDAAAQRELTRAVQAELDHVVALMSTWEPDSELSRFNRARTTEPIPISPDTARVIAAALATSRLSGGAFDVTVGPLVEAWGFGRTPRRDPPDAERVAALRGRVGYDLLELDASAGTLRKRHADVELDLSAIAKGFAVDRVAERLQELGHPAWLVEVGGELRAAGRKLDGAAWRVAIEQPDVTGRSIHLALDLHEHAMATSGDYRNFFEQDGRRISHTIDPRTGAPIEHALASVTVVHDSTMQADAWATALNVLGPEAGYSLALEHGLAVYMIRRTPEGGFATRATPAFEALLAVGEATASGTPGDRSS